jgi:MSHA biogenesis protein MshG
VLQRAGVPLLSSLHSLERQSPSGPLKAAVHALLADLAEGHTFWQALARHPETFDAAMISMARVGETGGQLAETLTRLTAFYEWELELGAKLRQAMQYPLIVVGILIVAVASMMVFVLPRFSAFFASLRIELPLATRLIMAVSQATARYGWLAVLGLIGAGLAVWRLVRTPRGRLLWDRWLLRLPILGPILLQLAMARLSRTVAALTASGVPILETLALAGASVNNEDIQQRLSGVSERVRDGAALSDALEADGLFPPMVVQMVATGEQTGKLDELLAHVGEYYDQQVAYIVRGLLTTVEPILLIVVGAGVLLMAVAVLVPMWDLVKLLKQGG